jgi:hypothetical protein
VLERAAAVPAGAVARLYVDLVDPEAYRLLDMEAVRDAASAALHLKVEPTFTDVAGPGQLPDLDTLPAQWSTYVDGQDLTGFDRDRVRDLGREYIARAIEEAG